ncbi:hypothetical protein F511_30414 [Dorcoceras hygrometricum]|uniref:Uncharacterized protein n=1 Tax=Dorcoceras hygrometricum TaxID=472368 RepID=A0A2Z7D0W7_9LAMI|nr:hypothetical protein F511_30414 [Dorcoceras hygrometricum]
MRSLFQVADQISRDPVCSNYCTEYRDTDLELVIQRGYGLDKLREEDEVDDLETRVESMKIVMARFGFVDQIAMLRLWIALLISRKVCGTGGQVTGKGRERAKRTKFLEGLNEELYTMVFSGKPKSYAEAVDSAFNIEEGLRSRRSRAIPQGAQDGRPTVQGAQSSQSSQSAHQPQQQQQQLAQQSGRQRLRPRGHQFKKKTGSGSSSSSGSRAEFCGYCGGKHPSTQCVGVHGSCNICGQYGHFV